MKKFFAGLLVLSLLLTMLVGCGGSSSDANSDDPTGLEGTISGNVYTNSKAGFSLNLNSDWTIATEEELASILDLTADMFTDSEVKNALEANGTATVFYASENTTGSTVNVTWEKVGLAGYLLTADSYIDSALTNLESTLSSAGFSNMVVNKDTATFAGKSCPAIVLSADYSGVPIYEIIVPVVSGTYVCCVTICTLYTNDCAQILSNISAAG